MSAPPGVEVGRLLPYLVDHGVIPSGTPVEIELLAAGRSNLTYALDAGDERLILRRPPLAHVLETAHDMAREYRVLTALCESAVPVPRTRWLCPDPEVIGRPFYVMERVDGLVCRREGDLVTLGPGERRSLGLALIDTLATLHLVDAAEVGLADFGRPEGFMERQLRRWTRQLADSSSRELPDAGALAERLGASMPSPPGAAVLHGDYRLDNLIVGAEGIRAVLDWEMSTLGDPMSDLGLFCLYYDGLPEDAVLLATMFGRVASMPTRAELLGRYGAATGQSLGRLAWYVGFAAFKLAVIIEGIYYRGRISTDPHGETQALGAYVEPLLATGLAALAADRVGGEDSLS